MVYSLNDNPEIHFYASEHQNVASIIMCVYVYWIGKRRGRAKNIQEKKTFIVFYRVKQNIEINENYYKNKILFSQSLMTALLMIAYCLMIMIIIGMR